MQVPLEITFHNVDHSDWVEGVIRERVAKLERIYDRITSCRVRVELRARHSNNTVPPVVRIEIGIPGWGELVVSHEPDRLQRRYQAPDARNAINDAFHIAERRLVELKNQRQRHTKQPLHDGERQLLGRVSEIFPEADHGFLLNNVGSAVYFHRNSLLSGDFDKLKQGDQLHYVEEIGDTGPIATKVRTKL